MKKNTEKVVLALLIAVLSVSASAAAGRNAGRGRTSAAVPKMPVADFFALCEQGKTEEVEKALAEKRAYVNWQNDAFETPLMVAILENRPALVDTLLKFKPKLEMGDEGGWTALMLAAGNDRVEIAEKLIKAGANVNANTDGLTALHAACLGGDDPKMVELLVAHGAYIEQQDDINEETPLMVAVRTGHARAVKALIAAGADARELPPRAQAAIFPQMPVGEFFALCEAGKADEVERTLAENTAYLNAKNDNVETPLMACVRANQPAVVDALLKFSPNLEAEGEDGWTALMFAAERDRLEIAEKLVNAGANVNANIGGFSALHAACLGSDDPKMVELLVAHGAKLEQKDDINGGTPLKVATGAGHTRAAKALIAAGARH